MHVPSLSFNRMAFSYKHTGPCSQLRIPYLYLPFPFLLYGFASRFSSAMIFSQSAPSPRFFAPIYDSHVGRNNTQFPTHRASFNSYLPIRRSPTPALHFMSRHSPHFPPFFLRTPVTPHVHRHASSAKCFIPRCAAEIRESR